MAFSPDGASVCGLLERITASLALEGENISMEFAPFGIKTVIITPA